MSQTDNFYEFVPADAAILDIPRHVAESGGRTEARKLYRRAMKPLMDVLLTLAAMPIILPVIVICSLLVMMDGRAPFFRQKRIGRDGRVFSMWKLRTMVPDAEKRLDEYLAANPEAKAEWDEKQKLEHDPRITSVGHFLRRSSLDEFPQFFNVLAGDMSLVGPRPMMVGQDELYPGTAYYRLRPGLTGPWQVSDRNASSFADRAWFDEAYLENVSLRTDCRLIAATVGAVAKGTGC